MDTDDVAETLFYRPSMSAETTVIGGQVTDFATQDDVVEPDRRTTNNPEFARKELRLSGPCCRASIRDRKVAAPLKPTEDSILLLYSG